MSHQPPTLYKIEPVPDAGLGITATSLIRRGTLIVAESPLFTTTICLAGTVGTSAAKALATAIHQVDRLSPEQQHAFYSLHNFHTGTSWTRLQGILLSNVIPLDDSGFCGVFLTCSRINHSCTPNSFYSWNTKLQKLVVYATAEIFPGTQITITYLGDLCRTYNERQQILLQEFSFCCKCHTCSLRGVELLVSDLRRREILALREHSRNEEDIHVNPTAALGYCKRNLELLREEGLEAMGNYTMYDYALRLCVAHGDLARTSAFAILAREALEACCGADVVGMKELKPYIKHPEKHKLAGASNIWRTRTKNALQKGSNGFEEWLWSRAV